MSRPIVLAPGEQVPLTAGGLSPLTYLAETTNTTTKQKKRPRTILVRCPCGTEFSALLLSVRRGVAKQCKQCRFTKLSRTNQVKFAPGASIQLLKGGPSGLTFVKDLSGPRHKVLVRCACGAEFAAGLDSIRSGRTQRCPECRPKHVSTKFRLLLKLNEPIPLQDGSPSKLTYLGDSTVRTDSNSQRKINTACPICGIAFSTYLSRARSGKVISCRVCAKRIHLIPNKLIPMTSGLLSTLKYIADVPSKNHQRKLVCECACGNHFETWFTSVRSGETTVCPNCSSARSNWKPGQFIGQYEVLEALPFQKGRACYKIMDHRENKVKTLSQKRIALLGPDLGFFRECCRLRFNTMVRRKSLEKASCFTAVLNAWSKEEFKTLVENRPDYSYHLDHVCPLALAQNETELGLLFHPSNLQWLPAIENSKKRDLWTPEGAALCLQLLKRIWKKPTDPSKIYQP